MARAVSVGPFFYARARALEVPAPAMIVRSGPKVAPPRKPWGGGISVVIILLLQVKSESEFNH